VVVGGSVIKDSEESSNECPVGGYHEWREQRSALAHVCTLCGKVSPVRCFEHPVWRQPTPLRQPAQPPPHEAVPGTGVERQAS
jgi:hypothetical protein